MNSKTYLDLKGETFEISGTDASFGRKLGKNCIIPIPTV